ncbi:MAG: GNAT family N-acetyltransferase [Thaumarchaeota archaeon]|nr:GNAT family N-acetyltransferase [Nitrososphaerota archaeon]
MPSLQSQRDGVTADLEMRDGAIAQVRVLRQSDVPDLGRFVDGLSEDSIYYRFLTSGISREALLSELSPKPGCVSLVAVAKGRIVGLSSYCRSGPETAEVGLLIIDEYQGKGLGTGLTERIARAANQDGVSMFEAVIDWNNTRMIELVRNLGFPTSEKVEPDLIRIRFPTSIDPVTLGEFQDRWVFRAG